MYIYLKSHIYRERDLESSFCREGGGPRQSARTIRTPSRRRKSTTRVRRRRRARRGEDKDEQNEDEEEDNDQPCQREREGAG